VISQNDGQKMVAFTENWPANDFQILVVAKLFYSSGYLDAGRLMVYKALEMNPRNVNALLTLVEDSGVAKSKKILIINELKSIDPFNSSFRNLKA
jgi:hypothetical protein